MNIAFGASSTLPMFCILWAMNGRADSAFYKWLLISTQEFYKDLEHQVVQKYLHHGLLHRNAGLTGCVIVLNTGNCNFNNGFLQGMWNIAHNLGGFAAPILAGTAARTFGWSVRLSLFSEIAYFKVTE